ncbi:trypco2 family protein [Streptomyces anulatus]|uniref:trypco2 family protein n=1 Tax=Streptomyces anulatus TaxID=1892 RepID=UPI00382F3521
MTTENTHALDGIELADAVASIRNQLIDAATRATDHPVSFAVGDIQMEFTLELRREAKAGGKVKAWVVEAGADAARTTGRTHKVAFTLTPRNTATGEAWEIGTEDDGSTAGFGGNTAQDDGSSAGFGGSTAQDDGSTTGFGEGSARA